MNRTTRNILTLATVILIPGLSFWGQTSAKTSTGRGTMPTMSVPSHNSGCKQIKGKQVALFDPATGILSGPITNAGILNGQSEDVINFGAGFIFTPDPTVLSYTSDLTIRTNHGELRATTVTTQSVISASGAEWGHINPDTSTGRFAGATGTIFFTFKPIGDPATGPYDADLTGEICLAAD